MIFFYLTKMDSCHFSVTQLLIKKHRGGEEDNGFFFYAKTFFFYAKHFFHDNFIKKHFFLRFI